MSFDYEVLNPEKLVCLNVSANNLTEQDLSTFSRFTNLESLLIGNDNKEHIQQEIFNKFSGSPEPLKSLTKLRNLHLSDLNLAGELNLESFKDLVKIYNVCNPQL